MLSHVRTGSEIRTFVNGKLESVKVYASINKAKRESRILQGALTLVGEIWVGNPAKLGGPNCCVRVGK